MVQIGIPLVYNLAREALVEEAKRVERLGFESVWLNDSFSQDPFIAASFLLSNTTTLKVGTGIATVYSRDAMAATQARETLSEYYPGRFLMGLGASNETIVNKRNGKWMPPVEKMSAYLSEMEATRLAHGRPSDLAPLHIAAHAPGLQKLALKYASGIITWILPVENIRQSRAYVGPDLEITAKFPCVLNEDPEEARKIARTFLSFYIGLDYYQRAYARIGFDPTNAENGGSDRLIDAIVAWGSPTKIKERVDEYAAAGATRVVLSPIRAAASVPKEGEWLRADPDLDSLPCLARALL